MKLISSVVFAVSLLSLGACVVGEEDEIWDEEDAAGLKGDTVPLTIVQHNVEKNDAAIGNAIREANQTGAIGIALQEVCPDQLAKLKQNHQDWTFSEVAHKHPTLNGCDLPGGLHDVPRSVAIYTGGNGANTTANGDLAGRPDGAGNVACVHFKKANVKIHLCSVHLSSSSIKDAAGNVLLDGSVLRTQTATKLKQLAQNEWIGGAKNDFVIYSGDFNAKPNTPEMDKLYDDRFGQGANGFFTEYNRSGQSRDGRITATANGNNTEDGQPYSKKIDYVLFSTNRAALNGADVTIVDDAADHNMVTSTVQMRK